jgi:trehalose-6-phosphate synthase
MDANAKFAATVVEQYHDGNLVWIHDYPLLLVPIQVCIFATGQYN